MQNDTDGYSMMQNYAFWQIYDLFSAISIMDGFPDELLDVVNDHWRQYPPENPLFIHICGVCFLFFTVICLFTNLLIIYVVLAAPVLRTPVSEDFCSKSLQFFIAIYGILRDFVTTCYFMKDSAGFCGILLNSAVLLV